MTNTERRSRGLTLVEVLVALTVSGAVVLAAHGLFLLVGDAAQRVPALGEAADLERNRERTLRELFGQIEVGTDSSLRFAGGPQAARFVSWCPARGGWRERCQVELAFVTDGDSIDLVTRWHGRVEVLHRGGPPARLYYLARASAGGLWLPYWGEALSAPRAVLLILGADTLLLRIGERG